MNFEQGEQYYWKKQNKKVTVKFYDEQTGYVYVRDNDDNSFVVRESELFELVDMTMDDILKREG